MQRKEQRQLAADVIDELPPRQRDVCRLTLTGHTVNEIADARGRSPSTIRTQLKNGTEKLKGLLAEKREGDAMDPRDAGS